MEFNVDPTPVDREVNPSHDRIKRVQFKREIENSIQQVAEIANAPQAPAPVKQAEEGDHHMEYIDTRGLQSREEDQRIEL